MIRLQLFKVNSFPFPAAMEKRELFHGELRGIPHNANLPRNKALSMDYKPGLTRALVLGGWVALGVPLDSHDVFHIVPLGKWTFKWMEMGWCAPTFSSKDLVCHPTETTILNSWTPKNGCEDGRWFFFSYLGWFFQVPAVQTQSKSWGLESQNFTSELWLDMVQHDMWMIPAQQHKPQSLT